MAARIKGPIGDFFANLQGLTVSSFFMEMGFIVVSLIGVFGINAYKQYKEGDELVYLETVEDPLSDIPTKSSSVIFRDRAMGNRFESQLAAIEGSIEIGDFTQARELWENLNEEEHADQRTQELILRIDQKLKGTTDNLP